MPFTNTQDEFKTTVIGVRHINPSIMEGERGISSILGNRSAVSIVRYAPIFLVQPSISGSYKIPSTLTCNPGVIDASPQALINYQWQANGVDILGATNKTFTTSIEFDTITLTCVIDAVNFLGVISGTSNGITAEIIQPIHIGEQVFYSISGLNQVGKQNNNVTRNMVVTGMWVEDRVDTMSSTLFGVSGMWVETRFDAVGCTKYVISGINAPDAQTTFNQDVYTLTYDSFDQNVPIINGDAETGDFTGWTITDPGMTILAGGVAPGAYYFMGGFSDIASTAYQDVAVPVGSETAIDASARAAMLSYFQTSYQEKDAARIFIQYLDSGFLSLGYGPDSGDLVTIPSVWTPVVILPVPIPPLTRYFRIHMWFLRDYGANNDSAVDNITVDMWKIR